MRALLHVLVVLSFSVALAKTTSISLDGFKPSSGAGLACPACPSTMCGKYCPKADPFVCTAGAAQHGCFATAGSVPSKACTACCDMAGCFTQAPPPPPTPAPGPPPTYAPGSFEVYRNVKDFGAVGDGVTDDTDAFIAALTKGKATTQKPGSWKNSQYYCQTTKPSFVYVPNGTYLISAELPLPYYTQLVGEWNMTAGPANNRPTLKFRIPKALSPDTLYCLSAGTDESLGIGWYGGVNQDNFFRRVANLIIDNTDISHSCRTIMHWMVSQATSLDHLTLKTNPTSGGLFMESGSGGYFGNIEIVGYSTPDTPASNTALKMGNQQFTVRNVTIRGGFKNGVHVLWGWAWQFIDMNISDVTTGFVLANGLAGISILDSVISGASFAAVSMGSATHIEIENLVAPSCANGIAFYHSGPNSPTMYSPNSRDGSFINLKLFNTSSTRNSEGELDFSTGSVDRATRRAEKLTFPHDGSSSSGSVNFPERKYKGWMRPGYSPTEVMTASGLVNGTDVTAALQALVMNASAAGKALRLPYGVYILTDTLYIPAGSKIFGEVWTRLTATGPNFQNESQIRPLVQVGKVGETGVVQLSDLLFTNIGPVPGAIMLEWNLGEAATATTDVATVSGIWDCHWRIGGAAGTMQGPGECPTNTTRAESPQCRGANTLLHFTEQSGNVFFEAGWGWVADHDIDTPVNAKGASHTNQAGNTNIYNDRGFIIASRNGPLWLVGTAAEHSQLFQYSFVKARNVFSGVIQTETPYMQPEFPLIEITPSKYDPPLDTIYGSHASEVTHALAIGVDLEQNPSSGELQNFTIHQIGSYSFFDRWNTNPNKTCGGGVKHPFCQTLLFAVYDESTSQQEHYYQNNFKKHELGTSQIDASLRLTGLSIHGANNTVQIWGKEISTNATRNGFCSTISLL